MIKTILSLLMVALALPAIGQNNKPGNVEIDVPSLQKLNMAAVAISRLYVDSVDQKKLVEDAINGMLNKLDPHSSYSNPENTKKLNEPLEGNFEGIGVMFNMLDDSLVVLQTVTKGPSEKVGIVAGDRIVSVNGEKIAGVKMSRDTIMKKLRGPKGSVAKLGIVRRGVADVLMFNVTRDKIPVNTIDAKYMITPTVGYIRLDRFGITSGKEMRDAIKELKAKGMKDLIFDLQMNGGGYLGAAIDIANEFLKSGDLVVYTEGRTAPRSTFNAKGGGLFANGRLVILVDEFTASAAEIVSGAVQDHDRGTIVGRRTFGKGLVQRPIDLPDGSMIRLTVSHYYTPSGRCIQKPYVKGEKAEYDQDLEKRFSHGELTSVDSIHLDSTKVYKTLVKGRTVYGGGGIMPDYFVPLDTTTYTAYYRAINRRNIFNPLVLKYLDGCRDKLRKQYKDFDDYIKGFEVPQSLIDSVESEAKKLKITPKDEAERTKSLPDIRFILKALIAYDVWDRSQYMELINKRSDIVKKALEVLGATK